VKKIAGVSEVLMEQGVKIEDVLRIGEPVDAKTGGDSGN